MYWKEIPFLWAELRFGHMEDFGGLLDNLDEIPSFAPGLWDLTLLLTWISGFESKHGKTQMSLVPFYIPMSHTAALSLDRRHANQTSHMTELPHICNTSLSNALWDCIIHLGQTKVFTCSSALSFNGSLAADDRSRFTGRVHVLIQVAMGTDTIKVVDEVLLFLPISVVLVLLWD